MMKEFITRTKYYNWKKRNYIPTYVKPHQYKPKYQVGDVGWFQHNNRRYFCVVLSILRVEFIHKAIAPMWIGYRLTYHLKVIK
jgi:acyl-ACP thioesterase